jgi:hypothetical protein
VHAKHKFHSLHAITGFGALLQLSMQIFLFLPLPLQPEMKKGLKQAFFHPKTLL